MRISDWSSDVCSSDLLSSPGQRLSFEPLATGRIVSTFMETEPYSGAHVCMPSIISVSGLCKSYATGTKALDNVDLERSEERRVGKDVSVRVDLGGRRIIKKKKKQVKTNQQS